MGWWEVGWEGQGEEESLERGDSLDRTHPQLFLSLCLSSIS